MSKAIGLDDQNMERRSLKTRLFQGLRKYFSLFYLPWVIYSSFGFN